MKAFLAALVLAQTITPLSETPLTPDRSVVVVADGALGFGRQQSEKVLDELSALLHSQRPLRVAWFDAEPVLRGFAVRGADRELIFVRPRTAMRKAMEIGLEALADAPGPHAMVVVAQAQLYPTSASMNCVLDAAQYSMTRIYTIHLAPDPNRAHPSPNETRSAESPVSRGFGRLFAGARAYSERDTSRQLKLMSEATGGWSCMAEDEPSAIACAATIADLIKRQ